tara:strand:+ start:41 stop:2029 length:1989 start_codon:yes stop_codon:yes gene_type:complete
MNAALVSKIGELKKCSSDELVSKISEGFSKVYLHNPSPNEQNSWRNSIPEIISNLPPKCDDLPIIVEMRMPIGNERADLILLGGNNQAIVVELKHWSGSINQYGSIENQVQLGGDNGVLRTHPGYQCDGYVGKLSNFHSIGNYYNIEGLVFLDSINYSQELDEFLNTYNSSIVYSDKTDDLCEIICDNLLPNSLTITDAEDFANGEYNISGRLVDFIRENQYDIKQKIYTKLADSGFSLCDEQLIAVNQILLAAKDAVDKKSQGLEPAKKAFVINGSPGSGKTLVALSLLIEAIGNGIKAIYGLRRNGALVNTLRNAIDNNLNDNFRDLSGLVYFINVPRNNLGIADARFNVSNLDLIICDEAQRMLKDSLSVIFERSPISAFFLDETQRLNWDEQGIKQNFIDEAEKNNVELIFPDDLPAGIRCRGGLPYHNFLESLLLNPNSLELGMLGNPVWKDEYQFKIFDDFDEFHFALHQARDNQNVRVAMVASWTESDGIYKWRLQNRPNTPLKNIRVSSKLQSGNNLYSPETPTISWVMNPDDYRVFWSGISSELDICASIYGSQGFESDIVGFIWGKDLVWDETINDWKLGGRNTSFDYSGGTIKAMSIKNLLNQIDDDTNHQYYDDARTLLLNRARIFLTRGILGTYIYCEDEKTREFLLTL